MIPVVPSQRFSRQSGFLQGRSGTSDSPVRHTKAPWQAEARPAATVYGKCSFLFWMLFVVSASFLLAWCSPVLFLFLFSISLFYSVFRLCRILAAQCHRSGKICVIHDHIAIPALILYDFREHALLVRGQIFFLFIAV